MKPFFENIKPVTGLYSAGICKILLVPIEWIQYAWTLDFNTRQINEIIELMAGKNWLQLDMVDNTYKFNEKPKRQRGVPYYDVSLTGLINDLDEYTYQTLSTFYYHQFACILYDRKRRRIVCGNKDAGMILDMARNTENNGGGNNEIIITLTHQTKYPAPFYITD